MSLPLSGLVTSDPSVSTPYSTKFVIPSVTDVSLVATYTMTVKFQFYGEQIFMSSPQDVTIDIIYCNPIFTIPTLLITGPIYGIQGGSYFKFLTDYFGNGDCNYSTSIGTLTPSFL